MATIYLPSSMTAQTGGPEKLVIEAPRVAELMTELVKRYPAFADALGEMAVAVDGEIYADADYISLGPETEVYFVPRVSGG